MLARRKPPKMRADAPRCEWPRHRKFVRSRVCIVPGCLDGPIECCHVRAGLPASVPSYARGGIGKKPSDAFTFPGCQAHHAESHRIGEHTFAKKYGINPLKEALDLARNSPCPEVRRFAREIME